MVAVWVVEGWVEIVGRGRHWGSCGQGAGYGGFRIMGSLPEGAFWIWGRGPVYFHLGQALE